MKTTIQVVGTRGVVATFDSFYDEARKGIEAEIDVSLGNILSDARARVPKKTGELAGTIRKERKPGDLFGFVYAGYGKIKRKTGNQRKRRRNSYSRNQKEPGIYAPVVEFGSKDPKHPVKPRPFLFPAWRLEKSPFDERLRKRLADVAARVMSGNKRAVSA